MLGDSLNSNVRYNCKIIDFNPGDILKIINQQDSDYGRLVIVTVQINSTLGVFLDNGDIWENDYIKTDFEILRYG